MLDFNILAKGIVSTAFLEKGISTFAKALALIKNMPYYRNTDKDNILCVLEENKGTCSTKHALLKRLAIENGKNEIALCLGIFNMNKKNTPQIAPVLAEYQLDSLPEAHTYLKWKKQIIDITFPTKSLNFEEDLLVEIYILPEQITTFKVQFHQNYIQKWLKENLLISYTLSELWAIREACIEKLFT